MVSVTSLMKPPFDRPQNFEMLFDRERQIRLLGHLNRIKQNAIQATG